MKNHDLKSKMKWVDYENTTGWFPTSWKDVKHVRRSNFWVDDSLESTGDAPKEFIHYYTYRHGERKSKLAKWPIYIAKTGQKWYPNESITEHLLTRIGQTFGFYLAESSLAIISKQLRFLSRHFHSRKEELVHGAEIYYGYLEDKDFVDQIETENKARSFFTLQLTKQALMDIYPEDYMALMVGFVEMILFDALVGNNDRHYYNWGIIQTVNRSKKPRFSPIYDTARGLLWNQKEEKVVSLYRNSADWMSFKKKYMENSKPKLGWEGIEDLNHFELVENVFKHDFFCASFKNKLTEQNLHATINVINKEFGQLISNERIFLIQDLLTDRYNKLMAILK